MGEWATLATMPLVAAVIGYVTKLAAVEMMFRPVEFVGIPPYLGWQGVIPRNAERMAAKAIDLVLDKLFDPRDIFDEIDLPAVLDQLDAPIHDLVDRLTRELMRRVQPTLWAAMPEGVQQLLIKRVAASLPAMLERLRADLGSNIHALIDIRMLAISALTRDKSLTVKLIRTIGSHEMRFIVRAGIPFGFLLGLAQALAWALTHSPWIMPAFGALTGLFTDWLALQMIFRPVRPRRYFGVFTWQGMFIKRREAVTRDYARLIADEIITPANVLEALLTGPQADRFLFLVEHEVQAAVDEQTGFARPLVSLALGNKGYQRVKTEIAELVVSAMIEERDTFGGYAAQAVDLPELLESKMRLMTDNEFEGLLRPAFKQDEWKLIVVGALLGFLIGEVQLQLLLT